MSFFSPESDKVIYKVQSQSGVFCVWEAEGDRWICDQLNVSDFSLFTHTETLPVPTDESLHRCDKYISFVP